MATVIPEFVLMCVNNGYLRKFALLSFWGKFVATT